MPAHPISWRPILILSSLYAWVFQVVSFPQAWRYIRGSNGIPEFTLNFGTRCRWVIKSKPRLLLPGENTGAHWTGGWVGSKDRLDFLGEEKIPCWIRTPNCQPVPYSVYTTLSWSVLNLEGKQCTSRHSSVLRALNLGQDCAVITTGLLPYRCCTRNSSPAQCESMVIHKRINVYANWNNIISSLVISDMQALAHTYCIEIQYRG